MPGSRSSKFTPGTPKQPKGQHDARYRIIRKGSVYNILGPEGREFAKNKSASVVGPRWEELTHTPWPYDSSAYTPGMRLWELGLIKRAQVGKRQSSLLDAPVDGPAPREEESPPAKAAPAPASEPAPEDETPPAPPAPIVGEQLMLLAVDDAVARQVTAEPDPPKGREEQTNAPTTNDTPLVAESTTLAAEPVRPALREAASPPVPEEKSIPVKKGRPKARPVIPSKPLPPASIRMIDVSLSLPAPRIDLGRQDALMDALRKDPSRLFEPDMREALHQEVAYNRPSARWASHLLRMLDRYDRRQRWLEQPTVRADWKAILTKHIAWQEQQLTTAAVV